MILLILLTGRNCFNDDEEKTALIGLGLSLSVTNLFLLSGNGEEALELGSEKKLKGDFCPPSFKLPLFLPLYLAK